MSQDNETYSLRLVTKFLEDEGIPYEHSSANVGFLFYDHGCRIKLNEKYTLSIQTHPDVAGSSFAETALQDSKKRKIIDDGTFDYYDVIRWHTPEKLFEHIKELRTIVDSKKE